MSLAPTSRPSLAPPTTGTELRRQRRAARWVALLVAGFFLGVTTEWRGAVVRPADGVVILAIGAIACRAVLRGRIARVRVLPELVFLLGGFAYQSANALILTSAGTAVKQFTQGLEILVVILLIARATRTAEARRVFLATLILAFGAIAVYTVYFHISIGSYFGYKLLNSPKLVFGLIAILWFSSNNGRNLFAISNSVRRWILPISILLMILSGERKGWVAFGFSALLMTWLPATRRRAQRHQIQRLYTVLAAAVCLLAAIPLVTQSGSDEIYTARQLRTLAEVPSLLQDSGGLDRASSYSNFARAYTLQESWRIFWTNPVSGIGRDRIREELRKRRASPPPISQQVHITSM